MNRRDAGSGEPFALVANVAGAMRIAAADAPARAAGIAPGQPLADARARAPTLLVAAHDRAADAAALRRLARFAGRYSAHVAIIDEGPGGHGLFLDVAGIAHLFGGEEGLARDLLGRLTRDGVSAGFGLADTPGAAWALARFHPEAARGAIARVGAGLAPLLPLPVAALRLPPRVEAGLRALGLKRVGDVAKTPRPGLARRFGPLLATRLDQAAGAVGEALCPFAPPSLCRVQARLAEPIITLDAVKAVAARLAEDLCASLEGRGLGARRLRLVLHRVDGETVTVGLGASAPLSEPGRMARLLAERLDRVAGRLDLGFGADAAALEARATEPLRPRAVDLDPAARAAADVEAARTALHDRLAARLGEAALSRPALAASHLPERAGRRRGLEAPQAAFAAPGLKRPLFLFAAPEPVEAIAEAPDGPPRRFRWRRVLFETARAAGPERLGAEWWRQPALSRDYFEVETREGRRFWLFREGLLGAETATPKWFVHGAWG